MISQERLFQLGAIAVLAVVDFLLLQSGALPDFMALPLQLVMFCLITSFIRHCKIEVSP